MMSRGAVYVPPCSAYAKAPLSLPMGGGVWGGHGWGSLGGRRGLRPLMRFCYYTGWRSGEVRSLTWAAVDFAGGVVRLEPGTTKNGEGREFPFAALPQLAALLKEQRERTTEIELREGRIISRVFHRPVRGRGDGQPILRTTSRGGRPQRRPACRERLSTTFDGRRSGTSSAQGSRAPWR